MLLVVSQKTLASYNAIVPWPSALAYRAHRSNTSEVVIVAPCNNHIVHLSAPKDISCRPASTYAASHKKDHQGKCVAQLPDGFGSVRAPARARERS